MKKELNDGLKNTQEEARQETKTKVKKALDELLDEGYERISITKELISERSKLHTSTLRKPHVIEVLEEYRVGQFKNTKKVNGNGLTEYIQIIEKDLNECKSDNKKLKYELELQSKKNMKLEEEIAIKQDEILTLRGQLMVLSQKLKNRDIKIK